MSILWTRDRACQERISIDFNALSLEEQVGEYDNVIRFRRQAGALFKQISWHFPVLQIACKSPHLVLGGFSQGFRTFTQVAARLLHTERAR